MKLFISADMEGISGVATNVQLKKESEYQRFRKLMTEDVNAAVDGAFAAGAEEVVVCDGHGNMSNILIEELDSRAQLISGNNRVMCQLEGLDASFDGVFFCRIPRPGRRRWPGSDQPHPGRHLCGADPDQRPAGGRGGNERRGGWPFRRSRVAGDRG